jgi:predicted ATPase/DNA-binding SARP family transcriptional activator
MTTLPPVAPPLTLRLFGPFEARLDGLALPRLRTRKAQWLLALLVLRGGAEVERDWLAGTLWPESSAAQGLTSLRVALAELRRVLGISAARLRSLSTHTLSLDLSDAEIDVVAFDAGVASDDPSSLAQAVALYRGPLLEGCREEWVFQERQAREQAYLQALERLAAYAMGSARPGSAERSLRLAAAVDPLRESAQRALMQALAAGGNYAAALRSYRELRLLLHRELNAEPDPETTALFQQIRAEARRRAQEVSAPGVTCRTVDAGASVLGPAAAMAARSMPAFGARPRSPCPRAHNLPAQLTPLVGRERDAAAARALLSREEVRLLTLTGPGGTGKTRLGLQVAAELLNEFADGICFVPLASIRDPDLVLPTIAQALGVREAPGQPLLETVKAGLGERQQILLLDNFEQVIAAAPLIAELLAAAPRLTVLVTSRERLHVSGEREFPVLPLALPNPERCPSVELLVEFPAVALFIQRARDARPDFAVTEETAPVVAEICRRLDGLPLAIELAAARIRLLPPKALLARLENRLALLTGGPRDLPARQQTLRNTIAWSYDLLEEPEKRFFRQLAIFAGGFTLEAAEAVCDPRRDSPNGVLEGLASLMDKSLLQQEEIAPGEPRCMLLETIREFGLERLTESVEEKPLRRRHAQFYARFARRPHGERQGDWLARLEREHDNLRLALSWAIRQGEAELCLEMVRWFSLGLFWIVQGHLTEGRERLNEILVLPGARTPTELRAEALRAAGVLASSQSDYEAACQFLRQSLILFRELGLTRQAVDSLHYLGKATCSQGDYPTTRSLMEESLAISREHGYQCETADALSILGAVLRREGDYERAEAIYEESLALYGGRGSRSWLVGRELRNLGHAASFRGEYPKAAALFREGLQILQETGQKNEIPGCIAGIAGVRAALGQPERGARLLGAAQALIEGAGAAWAPEEQAECDRYLAAARRQLPERAFAAAWAGGRTMSLDDAVAFALEDSLTPTGAKEG